MSATTTITAADVNKLRQATGAGMMDCKKALTETNGDFDAAVDFLRKKGQKVAAKRSERDAKEGRVVAKVTEDGKSGILIMLNCETDFVAKNEDFAAVADTIAEVAIKNKPASLEELSALSYDGNISIAEKVLEEVGKIGEKIELSAYETLDAEKVIAYNHMGNRLATLVSFNKDTTDEIAKDVAMQVAAMSPIAVDKDGVDQSTLDREIEIGKEQARAEGKPEEMLEKIATGKLNKFFKESTLLNQEFIKDGKKTVKQFLADADKELTVLDFKRVALG